MSGFSLKEKHRIEKDFHDEWAEQIEIKDICVGESFEAESALENREAMNFFGDIRGKRILDLGCGAGEASVYFAMKGAQIYAVDLSEGMLQKVRLLADHHGVDVRTRFMPAEKLEFDDNFFDCVYGSSVLHHVDVHVALKEAARVLKPDGKAVFIEPLSYNPLINVYRWIAKDVRTPTEISFSFKHLKYFREHFKDVSLSFHWLTTLWIFLYMFFIERINPVKDRYWKRIVREHKRYAKMFNRLNRLDNKILSICPVLKYLCWTTVIKLSRKNLEF